MPWDENNVSKLRELWDQGLQQLKLGNYWVLQKCCCWKSHRIGLERRPSPIRRTAVKPDRKKARSPVMPKLNFENSNDILSKPKEASSFQPIVKNIFNTMPKRGCEWPKGHPDEIDFHVCGKERFEDKPYCAEHCAASLCYS